MTLQGADDNTSVRGSRVVPSSGGGFDFGALAAKWQSQAGGGSTAPSSRPVVPLWRRRPARPTEESAMARRNRQEEGLAEGIPREPGTGGLAGYIQSLFDQSVDADQAGEAFLDMEDKDREEFKKLAVRSGMIPADATPEQVATAWRQATNRALSYNSGRSPEQWISPWEAVEKLGVADIAGKGGRFNGYAGYVGDVDKTSKSVQKFSSSDLAGDAEKILRETLGRGPSKAEIEKYTAAVNAAASKNPLVERTTGSIDASGNSNTVTTRTGGVDPNQIMLDVARQDPEFAPVQAATTFFEAAMRALGSVV